MNVVVIVNEQPYGGERPYNALRLASALSNREETEVRVFLMGDAVACAVAGQQLQHGHYHLDRMLKGLLHRAQVGCCGTCLDARGLTDDRLVDGARRSTLEELTDRTLWADQTPTFLTDAAQRAALSRAVRRWRPLPAIARRAERGCDTRARSPSSPASRAAHRSGDRQPAGAITLTARIAAR